MAAVLSRSALCASGENKWSGRRLGNRLQRHRPTRFTSRDDGGPASWRCSDAGGREDAAAPQATPRSPVALPNAIRSATEGNRLAALLAYIMALAKVSYRSGPHDGLVLPLQMLVEVSISPDWRMPSLAMPHWSRSTDTIASERSDRRALLSEASFAGCLRPRRRRLRALGRVL